MERRSFLFVLLICGLLLSCYGSTNPDTQVPRSEEKTAPSLREQEGENSVVPCQPAPTSADSDVIAKVSPAVVLVLTKHYRPVYGEENQHPGWSTGSGVVIDSRGYILTSYHVVAPLTRIKRHWPMNFEERELIQQPFVIFVFTMPPEGTEFRFERDNALVAGIVAKDERLDVAVLKVSPSQELAAAKLGNSDSVKQGDTVWALGYPLSWELHAPDILEFTKEVDLAWDDPVAVEELYRKLENSSSPSFGFAPTPSVSKGIVSAIYKTGKGTVLQTDASINPGNSGGPLVNANGEVTGVLCYKMGEGMGYAVPVREVEHVVQRIHTTPEPPVVSFVRCNVSYKSYWQDEDTSCFSCIVVEWATDQPTTGEVELVYDPLLELDTMWPDPESKPQRCDMCCARWYGELLPAYSRCSRECREPQVLTFRDNNIGRRHRVIISERVLEGGYGWALKGAHAFRIISRTPTGGEVSTGYYRFIWGQKTEFSIYPWELIRYW